MLLIVAPITAQAADVDAVCADVLNSQEQAQKDPTFQQKLQYCQAAKSSDEAASNDGLLWKIWAGVATVCAGACAASLAGAYTNQYICVGANVAAAGTDALMSRDFSRALMGIMSAGTPLLINYGIKKMGTPPKDGEEPKDKDIGSCVAAGTAALQAFSRHSSAQSQEQAAKSALESAKQLGSMSSAATAGNATAMSAPAPIGISGSGAGTAGGSSSGLSTTSSQPAAPTTPKANCAMIKSGNTYQGMLDCAVASDRTLPGFVSDKRFANDFKKTSGMSFPDFMKQAKEPKSALAAGMGAGLSAQKSSQLQAALGKLEKYTHDERGSSYAGGGGGGGGGGGDDAMGAQMAEMMGKMMEQIMPGKEEEKQKTGLTAVAFANKNRSPASVQNDPSLSIFDRITYRYRVVEPRFLKGEL